MAAGMVSGCAVARPPSLPDTPRTIGLRLLDTVVFPSQTTPPDGRRDRWFGSLSGLARDEASGRYLAVVDDREPSRVAWLDIRAVGGRLAVTPGAVVPLEPVGGLDPRTVVAADLESVVAMPDGTWVASEEGHVALGAPGVPAGTEFQPALVTIDAALRAVRVQPWPARFWLGPERGGVRDNQGFEGLTRTPDGRLIAGLEQPLHADMAAPMRDGHPFGGGRGGPGRLVELVPQVGEWRPGREWVYPLDATAVRPGERICDDGENGLTELLALDDTHLLSLERACLLDSQQSARNTARVFLVELARADDVSPTGGMPIRSARPVAKRLLVDFDALIPRLPAALARLDNFEGLAFGPSLPDGTRTLLVMSDDNFRPTQRTVFVWFRVEEKSEK
jgi:hypothetical protein